MNGASYAISLKETTGATRGEMDTEEAVDESEIVLTDENMDGISTDADENDE